jgi:hypothetical protein
MFRGTRALLPIVLLLGAGCGGGPESGPKVTGRLLIDGQPCRPASVNDFDVKFLTVEGAGPAKRSYLAEVKPDGSFTLNGSMGKGIPVGRYKVSITGKVLGEDGKPTGQYLSQFADGATPLEVEIIDRTREITIDLANKTAIAS